MKKIIFLLIINSAFSCFSQKMIGETSIFKGNFAYENDDRLRSLDDMIYRKSALFLYQKGRVQNQDAIFIFESSINNIDLGYLDDGDKEKIKNASNFFNDQVHDILKSEITVIISQKNFTYKIFNLTFKALYLGILEHPVRKKDKFINKKMDTYLIYDFIKIDKVTEAGASRK